MAKVRPGGEEWKVPVHKIGWFNVRGMVLRAFEAEARHRRMLADTWLVLEHITRVAWWHAKGSPRHAVYAVCSEAWLAEQVGCRRETISAHVSRLQELGLLEVTHRRQVAGQWQTNLYCLGGKIWARLRGLVSGYSRSAPLREKLDQSRRDRYVYGEAHAVGKPMQELLDRWFKRGSAEGEESDG